MATAYDRAKLSSKMQRTPEGYLKCLDAVIARTGYQTYKGSELPQDELEQQGLVFEPDEDVQLLRTPENVFKKSAIDSFQGKVFTVKHPGDLLNLDTTAEHDCGHVFNVRKGEEPLEDGNWPLLADIVVTDADAIYQIEVAGIRELSCGYNYHILKDGKNLLQVGISGNHVALVEKGRAGALAKIQDAAPIKQEKFSMSKFEGIWKALGFKEWAKDAKPEDLASAMDELKAAPAPVKAVATDAHPEGCKCTDCMPAKDAADGNDKKAADRKRQHDALDRYMDGMEAEQNSMDADVEALKKMFSGMDAADAEPENEEEEIEENAGEDEDPEADDEAVEDSPSPVIPEEARAKSPAPSAVDSYSKGKRDALNLIKPLVAKSTDKKLRAAFDAAFKQTTKKAKTNTSYSGVGKAASTLGKAATDSLEKAGKSLDDVNDLYKKARGKAVVQID